MPKITFIGAGSTVFAKNLLADILAFPELANSTISLMDIDPVRLKTTEIVAHKIAEFFGAKPKIEATLDRRVALDGADYAISMFQVGGYKPSTVIDFEIPKKYGIKQTIADTLGIAKSIPNCWSNQFRWSKAKWHTKKVWEAPETEETVTLKD